MVQTNEVTQAASTANERMTDHLDEAKTNYQASSSQLTFTFTGEDHTLGNALRSILVRKPGVQFAGYSIPHPNQPEMNIRLQTTGQPAMTLLRESLDDLASICDHLDFVYDEALDHFQQQQQQQRAGTTPASST